MFLPMIEKDNKNTDLEAFKIIIALVVVIVAIIITTCYNIHIDKERKVVLNYGKNYRFL